MKASHAKKQHGKAAAAFVALLAGIGLLSGSAALEARTLTVAVAPRFPTLDPYDATDALSRNVAKSFYEGLFAFNDKLEPKPQLAESYEVSDDGLTYVF